MGIGFRILLVKRSTVIKILTDYLYKEDQTQTKNQIKKKLKEFLDSYLEDLYFKVLRHIPIEEYENYLRDRFNFSLNDQVRESLGIPFIKHFFK
ncbi:MAG: hypothetical protein ACFFBT_04660 [Promethearchaeota archaeon]